MAREKENQRRNRLKYMYGLLPGEYERMWSEQGGCCAICRRALLPGRSTHVDHCHRTGRVRGILCRVCNMLLGHAGDSVTVLEQAVAYLVRNT